MLVPKKKKKKLVQLFHKSVGVKQVCGEFSTLTFATGHIQNPRWCPTASTAKKGPQWKLEYTKMEEQQNCGILK